MTVHLASYLLVSAPKVVQPISVLGETTGSYGRGFRCDEDVIDDKNTICISCVDAEQSAEILAMITVF